MDSRHIGSDELIYIQTDSLSLTIKGMAFHPSVPGVKVEDKASILKIVCDEDCKTELSGDAEAVFSGWIGRTYSQDYKLQPLFFEQQRYELLIEPAEGHTVSFWHENYNIRNKITPIGRKRSMLSGIINFGNDIGFSDLVIILDGHPYMKLTIEVFPSKISYKEDYKAIVADITAEVYNLVFDFLKKTYASFDISSSQQSSPVEFFAIIRKIYSEFISAADMILRNPHHQLQKEYEELPYYKIRRTDNRTIRWLEKHPEKLKRVNGTIRAEEALAVKKYVTYDTKENRLTKFMLEQTARRLEQFKNQYCGLGRETDSVIVRQIETMSSGILRRCSTGFMNEVNSIPGESGMSLVFNMAPGYRELYRCYLLLQHGLTVTGSIFNTSVKDLAVLYEYWCFIKLNSLMRRKYELKSQDIIRVDGSGLFVSLVKGQPSTVKYVDPVTDEEILLSYNPKETKVPTVMQRPDNVLSLKKKGADINYEYVFDAKYRINPALKGTDYYLTVSHNPGPEISDINTMHRYRDAIVYQSDVSPYERTMFGAYVLFPYHNEEEYKEHRFYKSIDQVNIGGLPFLPSATSLVENMLDELITDSPDSAFERTTLPRGIERKLAKVDWSKRDVLVGTVSGEKQLNACIDYNFYIVPVTKIKESNLPIHYVALYQSKNVFGKDARIEYYGEVKTTEIVKGTELTEISCNPDLLYYVFEIREWEKLRRPIESAEEGKAYMFTNMFLLTHSSRVPELTLQSEEEYRLFSELKRRTEAAVLNNEGVSNEFILGDKRIVISRGEIILLSSSEIIQHLDLIDFTKKPNATLRRLKKYL